MRRVVGMVVLLGSAAQAAESAGDVGGGGAVLLDTVTVTATRSEKLSDDVPASVSVITDRAIADRLVTDIKDLVRLEPGVAVRTEPARFTAAGASTGRDGQSGFNIRGLEGNRILIQVDGVRLPDAYAFGAQSVGRGDYVDLSLLKSVEILRGPASALYGSDGVAGAVSFTTKDPADLLQQGRAATAQASLGYSGADRSWAESALVAGSNGRWHGMLAYSRRDGHAADNRGDNKADNTDRTAPNPQDTRSNAALAKLIFDIDDTNRLRLTGDHFDRKVATDVRSAIAKPPLASTSAIGLQARDTTKRNRVTLDHLYTGSNRDWISEAHTSISFQNSDTRQYAYEDRFTAVDRIRDNSFDNRTYGLSTELRSNWNTGQVSHQLVYGGDVWRIRQESIRTGTVPPAGETFPSRSFPLTKATLAGLYVQDEIALAGGRLTLFPALRFDYYELDPKRDALFAGTAPASQRKSHLSPKFGAVVKLTDATSLFANYAAGFKAPAPSQVNNGFANPIQNYRSISNPDLKPETSDTIEAGIRFRQGRYSFSASAFKGWYENFIEQVQTGGSFTPTDPATFQYINLRRVEITGAEAKGQALLAEGLSLNLAASYTRGTTKSGGVTAPLDSVEPWKLTGGLSWREPGDKFGGTLTAVYSSGKDRSRVAAACTPSCFTPPAFTLVDLTAFWQVAEPVTLRVGVFNIFDRKYWWWSDVRGISSTSTVRDAYTQPGRNVSASVAVRF